MKKLSLSEFLDNVKVIRMLYGVTIATLYYEKNINEFFGDDSLISLRDLKKSDRVKAPRDIE